MTTHRNVEIIRTEAVHLDTGRRLYGLVGEITKLATQRPFLTTKEEAVDYINAHFDGAF